MRTLKRTLCLVLCLVMMLGLCVFNVGATSFSDDADIDEAYDEAAEVLTAVGVFRGQDLDNDGTADAFGPKSELKRKEGAHLISRLLLGINSPVGVSTFSDVAAEDTAEVALMEVLGITDGYGDGTFGPDDNLTGSMFAKWLSVTLGYSAADENMTGPEWEVGVAILNKSVGLNDGIANYDPTAVLTREKAAQMCLNALKATMVEYSGGIVVSEQGITLTAGGTRSYRTAATNAGWAKVIDDDTDNGHPYVELGEWLYNGDLTLDLTTFATDDFGRPANVWEYKGTLITKAPKTPVKVYTGRVGNASTIAADLSQYRVWVSLDGGTTTSTTPYYITTQFYNQMETVSFGYGNTLIATNGYYDPPTNTNKAANPSELRVSSAAYASLAEAIQKLTANGKRVEIYANEYNYITRIVVIEYTVNKITSVTEDSNGVVAYSMNQNGTAYVYPDARHNTFNLPGGVEVAKDDYVTVTKANADGKDTGYYYAYPTEVVTGPQTAYSADNVTVDGKVYAVAKGVWRVAAETPVSTEDDFEGNTTKDVNLYLDQYGYAVARDEVITSADYAVVAKIAYPANGGVNASNPQAQLVFADGSKKTVTVSKISKDGVKQTTYATDGDGDFDNNQISRTFDSNVGTYNDGWNQIVKYTEKSNGEYEIDYTGTNATASKTFTNITGYYALREKFSFVGDLSYPAADSNTVYVVRTGNNDFDVSTGYGNAPTVRLNNANYSIWYQLNKAGTKIVMVYFDKYKANNNILEYTNGTEDNIFYTWGDTVNYNNAGTMTYTIGGVLNGEADTYTLDSDTSLSPLQKHTFYKVKVDANKKVSDGTVYEFASTGVATSSVVNTISTTNFNGYLVYSGTKVFFLDNDAKTSTSGAVTSVSVGDAYYIKTGSGGNANRIDEMYVIKGAGGTVIDGTNYTFGEDAIKAANDGDTITDLPTVYDNVVLSGELTIDGDLTLNDTYGTITLLKGSSLTVYGDVEGGEITVMPGATLIISNGTDETAALSTHVYAADGSTLTITGNTIIQGNSLVILGDATITGNVTLQGLLMVYADVDDASLTINGNLTIGTNASTTTGSLQLDYNTEYNCSAKVTVTGNLRLNGAMGGTYSEYLWGTYTAANNLGIALRQGKGVSLVVQGAVYAAADPSNDDFTVLVTDNASFTSNGLYYGANAKTDADLTLKSNFKAASSNSGISYKYTGTTTT